MQYDRDNAQSMQKFIFSPLSVQHCSVIVKSYIPQHARLKVIHKDKDIPMLMTSVSLVIISTVDSAQEGEEHCSSPSCTAMKSMFQS